MMTEQRPMAKGDIEKIRAWSTSEEGIRKIKEVLQWAKEKEIELRKAQRVDSRRLDRAITR